MRVTGDFNKFKPTTIENITLEKGEQIMRIYFDFAFYNMGTITVKKSGTSAINLLDISESVNIYPNPTTGILQISGKTGFDKFTIQSLTGQNVLQGEMQNEQIIDVSNLYNGNYILILRKGDFIVRKKIVKL